MHNYIPLSFAIALSCGLHAQDIPVIQNGACPISVPIPDNTINRFGDENTPLYYKPDSLYVEVNGYDGKLGVDYEVDEVSLAVTAPDGMYDFRLQSPSGVLIHLMHVPTNKPTPNLGAPGQGDACTQNLIFTDTASVHSHQCPSVNNCIGRVMPFQKHIYASRHHHPDKEILEGLISFNDGSSVNGRWKLFAASQGYYETDSITHKGKLSYFKIKFKPIAIVSGITDEQKASLAFSLYPNPANSAFSVDLNNEQPALLEVYDVNGKNIYRNETYQSQQNINASTWPKGLYSVHVTQNKQHSIKKLLRY